MILQESNLLERLRDELLIPDLIFDIQINIEHFPDYKESKFIPTLSQKDKFVLMVEKNSKLEAFTHKFGLKLDTGG